MKEKSKKKGLRVRMQEQLDNFHQDNDSLVLQILKIAAEEHQYEVVKVVSEDLIEEYQDELCQAIADNNQYALIKYTDMAQKQKIRDFLQLMYPNGNDNNFDFFISKY
jgi:hypothetical protein